MNMHIFVFLQPLLRKLHQIVMMCDQSLIVSRQIFRALPSNYNIARPILDQYLTLLVDDPVKQYTLLYICYLSKD